MCPNISSLRQFIADLNVRIVPQNCASVGSPGREQHEITGPGDNAADVSIGLTWNSQITANTSQVSELQSAFPPLHHKLHEADRMGKSLLFPCFSAWPEPPLHDTARAATQKYKIIKPDLTSPCPGRRSACHIYPPVQQLPGLSPSSWSPLACIIIQILAHSPASPRIFIVNPFPRDEERRIKFALRVSYFCIFTVSLSHLTYFLPVIQVHLLFLWHVHRKALFGVVRPSL